MAKPWKDLVAPLKADPQRWAKIQQNVDEMEREIVASRLAEIRKAQGIGQQELAERLNISQSTVSNLEHSADPKLSTLVRYAAALDATISVVITPEGKEPVRITG